MQGAAAIPAVLLLVFGLGDLREGLHDWVGVSRAVDAGLEIALLDHDDSRADCLVIEGVADLLGSRVDQVERIEIQHNGQATSYSFDSGAPTDCQAWPGRLAEPTDDPAATIGVRIRMEHTWSEYPPFTGTYMIDKTANVHVPPT